MLRDASIWSHANYITNMTLGSIPGGYSGFFSSSWLTNVDGMKDLWCSSRVQLLSTQ